MRDQNKALERKRKLLGLARQLGNILNVSATSLGIVIMGIAVSSVLLQPVRDPLKRAYEAMLQTASPASDAQAFAELTRRSRNASAPDASSPDGLMQNDSAQEDPQTALSTPFTRTPGTPLTLADLRRDFDRVLDDNPDDLEIHGMTGTQFQALRRYLSRRYRIAQNVAGALIQAAHMLGRAENVDPQLLLAIIAIESRYNPFAESHVGAQGLMQVMPRVHRDKFEALGLDIAAAVEPIPNMIVGTRVYTDCRRRRGSVTGALACYVGATGPGDGGYSAKVLAERRRIARASGIAPLED